MSPATVTIGPIGGTPMGGSLVRTAIMLLDTTILQSPTDPMAPQHQGEAPHPPRTGPHPATMDPTTMDLGPHAHQCGTPIGTLPW